MAERKDSKKRTRSEISPQPRKRLNYFWLDDKLYQILHVSRPSNTVTVWSHDDEKRMVFVWSDIQRSAKPALSTAQVARLVNRHRITLLKLASNGQIPLPRKVVPYGTKEKIERFKWSEKDIMGLHDWFLTRGCGRPRKDGFVNPVALPTKAEIKAMMNNDTVIFVKNKDGEYVEAYKGTNWN